MVRSWICDFGDGFMEEAELELGQLKNGGFGLLEGKERVIEVEGCGSARSSAVVAHPQPILCHRVTRVAA